MPKKNEFRRVAESVDQELATRRRGVGRCRRGGETGARAVDGRLRRLDGIERWIEVLPPESTIFIADEPHAGPSQPAHYL